MVIVRKIKVEEIKDGEPVEVEKWIVADCYDGEPLAGPFNDEGKAHQAVSGAKKKALEKQDARGEAQRARRRREGLA